MTQYNKLPKLCDRILPSNHRFIARKVKERSKAIGFNVPREKWLQEHFTWYESNEQLIRELLERDRNLGADY